MKSHTLVRRFFALTMWDHLRNDDWTRKRALATEPPNIVVRCGDSSSLLSLGSVLSCDDTGGIEMAGDGEGRRDTVLVNNVCGVRHAIVYRSYNGIARQRLSVHVYIRL